MKELMENQEILKELEFNISSRGFNYWLIAIELYEKNKNYGIITIQNIYDEIADLYHTTARRVERCMRTARKNSDNNIKEQFNYKGKITNLVTLKLLCS